MFLFHASCGISKGMITVSDIDTSLRVALSIAELRIEDFSAEHAGHNADAKRGGTHFRVLVVSNDFGGLSRVRRHQLVYEALKDLMERKLHALTISALTPQEWQDQAPHR